MHLPHRSPVYACGLLPLDGFLCIDFGEITVSNEHFDDWLSSTVVWLNSVQMGNRLEDQSLLSRNFHVRITGAPNVQIAEDECNSSAVPYFLHHHLWFQCWTIQIVGPTAVVYFLYAKLRRIGDKTPCYQVVVVDADVRR